MFSQTAATMGALPSSKQQHRCILGVRGCDSRMGPSVAVWSWDEGVSPSDQLQSWTAATLLHFRDKSAGLLTAGSWRRLGAPESKSHEIQFHQRVHILCLSALKELSWVIFLCS